MSNSPLDQSSSLSDDAPETLTDRVAARVTNARLAIEKRAGRSRSRRRNRVSEPALLQNEAEVREVASLKQVFRDLGTSYRSYRSQTGEAVNPGLREAAYGFRAKPSLASLVTVAAYLDELDLLS
jgi:hypothetical protein